MNKTKHAKNGAANAVVEAKRYEEAFKRQAVEHTSLRSDKNGAPIAKELGMSCPEKMPGILFYAFSSRRRNGRRRTSPRMRFSRFSPKGEK